MKSIKYDGDDRTDAVKNPWGTHAIHQRIDDRGHGVGLWSGKLSAREAVGLVEHNHHTHYGGRTHERSKELPCLLLLRSGAQPVTYLQVGDEATGH